MSSILGKCPLCEEGNILEKDNSFGCSKAFFEEDSFGEGNVNTGCNFYIFKESFKRYGKNKIYSSEVKKILRGDDCIGVFRSKFKREKYKKYIVLDLEFGVSIDFDTEVE